MNHLTLKLKKNIAQKIPDIIGIPLLLVPYSIQKHVFGRILQRVFHESIINGDMDFLHNKYIRFSISDCNFTCNITLEDNTLKISNRDQADADIKCKLQDFILLANRKVDPDTLFFQRRLIIEGDTDLGLTMKNTMDNLDPEKLPTRLTSSLKLMENILLPEN